VITTFVVAGAVFGLVFGSFLNVVVYRCPRALSVVRPPSFCPWCKTEIQSRDNVPLLSWIVLGGRCRHCKGPISIRYPLVEAATALVFVAIALNIRPLWGCLAWWMFATCIAIPAVIETDGQSCPPGVTLWFGSVGLAALVVGALTAHEPGPLWSCLIGLAGGGLAAAIAYAKKSLRTKFDGGTLVALAAVGACFGWLGVIPALVGCAVAAASIVAGLRFVPKKIVAWAHIPVASGAALGVAVAVLAAALRA
jgi:leader peptidase (prepilin peptidase)/N-methyltransferase